MISPERWRRRPVVVEAVRVVAGRLAEIAAWCGGYPESYAPDVDGVTLDTEDAPVGSWIIHDPARNSWIVVPGDVFEAEYVYVGPCLPEVTG